MEGHNYQKAVCLADSFGWIFQATFTSTLISNNYHLGWSSPLLISSLFPYWAELPLKIEERGEYSVLTNTLTVLTNTVKHLN